MSCFADCVAKLAIVLLMFAHSPAVAAAGEPETPQAAEYFQIRVIDEQTGRGVPLVELETVHHVRYITDSQGRVAFHEVGLMGQRIYFSVRSHGYQFAKDGFGNAGTVLHVQPGGEATIKIRRVNLAERLYRITGQGIDRDSVMLGKSTPTAEPLGSGRVAGQDSAFAVPYRDKIYWFWGDTLGMSYPLGHFWMAGAVSDFPGQGGLDPAHGVDLTYFTDAEGFSRPMARLGVERGLIWADTFMTVTDADQNERLVCRYAHMESLAKMLGHGLAIYNDQKQEFERLKELELKDHWRFPAQSHPIRIQEQGRTYLYFGSVFPTVRVPAELDCFTDLNCYEYFTCLSAESSVEDPKVQRDAEGQPDYRWVSDVLPMDEAIEQKLIESGEITAEQARFSPQDIDSGERVRMHRGSVSWNAYRNCWILIAGQLGGTSLGEIWYSEASQPTGPWLHAKKIVTHDRYTFYNPVQHPFFDQQGGRLIYFEGTYTHQFSETQVPTPRYDYNQIMYRLDVSDPRLRP